MLRHWTSIVAALLCCLCARAQFYSAGTDPAAVSWLSREGRTFRVIYPRQDDSLAVRYLDALERYAPAVGRSIGYTPNAKYSRPMPVVLHPYFPEANGSVSWAPRIMNLYTVQDAYAPDPYPWTDQLAIHESRHVSQMQFGRDRAFWPLFVLTGQLATGGLCAVYGGPTFFEGDAVTAETALTKSGRGRTADFLEYYMAAFDAGDWRDWYRWNYGSMRWYTPDYYRVGYMTVAGTRALYDDPLFSARFYKNVFRKRTNVLHKTMREASGQGFRRTFREIEQYFQDDWASGQRERAPFMRGEQFTGIPKHYESFSGLVLTDRGLYAVRSGMDRPQELVRLREDGSWEHVAWRSASAGTPVWSEADGRLYWSETLADRRWSLCGSSRIRYYDLQTGRQGDLTTAVEGRLFNPFPVGRSVYAVDYPVKGGSAVVEVDASSGVIIRRWEAPDGLQVVEVAMDGGRLIASGISGDGCGLYDVEGGYSCVLAPQPVKIKQLRTVGGVLHFVSDRTGVNEVYTFESGSGRATEGIVRQVTNTKFGAADYAFSADGRTMWHSSLTRDARSVCRMSAGDIEDFWERHDNAVSPKGLAATCSSAAASPDATAHRGGTEMPAGRLGRIVDFGDIHHYAIADKLSAQEAGLAEKGTVSDAKTAADTAQVAGAGAASRADMPPARKYGKAAHLLRLHSWLPVSVSYDNVLNLSEEDINSIAGLGATAFFQNDLGTMSGYMSYKYQPGKDYRNGFSAQFSYTGLYPVIEASVDYADRQAYTYRPVTIEGDNGAYTRPYASMRDKAYCESTLRVYVPLNFSSGGWSRGLIPQAELTLSNDIYNKSMLTYGTLIWTDSEGNMSLMPELRGIGEGESLCYGTYKASVRGYSMLGTPSSSIYPRLGIGAELGVEGNAGLDKYYSPGIYAYLYGYLPGMGYGQGWRLTALAQANVKDDAVFMVSRLTMTPRGTDSYTKLAAGAYRSQLKLTADYAIPFAPLDFALGQLAYIRNLELIPHADIFVGWGGNYAGELYGMSGGCGTMYSAGASLAVHLGNLAFIPYDTRIGLDFNRLGGSIPEDIRSAGGSSRRLRVGMVFSIEL